MKILLYILASITSLSITYELYHPLFNINAEYWIVFAVNVILIFTVALLGERGELNSYKKPTDFYRSFDSIIYYQQIFNLIHIGIFLIFMFIVPHSRLYVIDIIFLLIIQFIAFVSGNKSLQNIIDAINK